MQELSMHILDIAQNSIKAGAKNIRIDLEYADNGLLTLTVADDGSGMSPETVARVTNPFYTSRTTRKVGLGIPLLKMSAEQTGGDLVIRSQPGVGTTLTATFFFDHIDMMPLGGIGETLSALLSGNPAISFAFTVRKKGLEFVLESRQIAEILDGLSIDNPAVSLFLKDYADEQVAALLAPS